jgi:hypothetical protein
MLFVKKERTQNEESEQTDNRLILDNCPVGFLGQLSTVISYFMPLLSENRFPIEIPAS